MLKKCYFFLFVFINFLHSVDLYPSVGFYDTSVIQRQKPKTQLIKTNVTPGEEQAEKSKRNKWTPEDDANLRESVAKNGRRWTLIAKTIGNRSARQCRERWKFYVDGTYERRDWTQEENDLLLQKIEVFGLKWSILSKFFVKRSEIDIRNRYSLIERRRRWNRQKQPENEVIFFAPSDAPEVSNGQNFDDNKQKSFSEESDQNSLDFCDFEPFQSDYHDDFV
jgi:hypothetical protein